MTNTDLAGRGITDARIRPNELDLRLILDTIPGFVWTMTATGEVELVNRQMLDYFRREIRGTEKLVLISPRGRPSSRHRGVDPHDRDHRAIPD